MAKRRSVERQNGLALPGEDVLRRIIEDHNLVIDDLDLVACTPRRREAALEMLAGFPAKGSAKKAARFHARHELRARLNREAF